MPSHQITTSMGPSISPKFITFEGIDGAGKSTHLQWFAQRLSAGLRPYGKNLVVTREPGGTRLGEAIRTLVLGHNMHVESATLLLFAARKEHLAQVIEPALAQGNWVLSDRFTDATFAYQGGGHGLDTRKLDILESWVHEGLQPDITLLFDLEVELARSRHARAREPDQFEAESNNFFARTRMAYLRRAQTQSGRFIVVDASSSIEQVQHFLEDSVLPLCLR
jgi:dTMP kinase